MENNYWQYQGEIIDSIDKIPEGAIGIIYNILIHDTGQEYIGKKQLFSKRKRRFGKKEIAKITDKRKKHWEYVIKESDWKTYNSSNDKVKELITNGAQVTKYILQFAYSKKELSYLEEKHLMCNSVLEHGDKFLNDNVSGRYFRRDITEKAANMFG